MKKETKSKVTHIDIDNMLRNGLEKNIGISKEQTNNYIYFFKKHIENNLGKSITNDQTITIEKLIAKSIFLGEFYILGLIENNKHLINICEALKSNLFYEACVFNYLFSTRQHEISEINFLKKNK
jgi:ABC-type microcin C transport system permease subunit YejB